MKKGVLYINFDINFFSDFTIPVAKRRNVYFLKIIVFAVLLFLFKFSYQVQAAETYRPEPGEMNLKAEEKTCFKLNDIVVTATQYEKTAFDTPVPVTIINKEEIDKISPSNIGELLKNVPGIEIHHDSTPGISKARIRGLSANRVAILIDGKRWNSHVSSLTGGVSLNEVDVNQIEKIEILHGPGTVLYGSGAIGGVINIITKKPPNSTEKYFSAGAVTRYSSVNNMKSARTEIEFGARGFNAIIGASQKKAEDTDTPKGKLKHSNYEDTSLDIAGKYLITDKQSACFSVTSFRGKISTPKTTMENTPMEFKDIWGDLDIPMLNSDVDCIFDIPKVDRDAFNLDYKIKKPFSWLNSFNIGIHGQKERMEYTNSTIIMPDIMPGKINVTLNGELNTDTYSVQARGLSTFNYGFSQTLTFGGEFSKDKVDAPGIIDTSVSIMGITLPGQILQPSIDSLVDLGLNLPPQFTKLHTEEVLVDGDYENIGFYIQDEIQILKNLYLSLGGRFDYFKAMDNLTSEEYTDEAVTGGIGLLYSLTDFINLAGSVSLGFRAPSLEERFYYGAVPGGTLLKGNPDIESEKSINYEAGIKINHSKFSGGITGFYNKIDDYILMTMSDESTVATFNNKGEVEIYGIEGSLDYQISRKWSAFSSLSYARGEDKTGKDPLEGMPPLKTILGLKYEKYNLTKKGRFWAEIYAKFFADQNRVPDEWTDNQKVSAFQVYDFRMGVTIASTKVFKNISLTFAVENFTDTTYESFPMICMYGWDDSLIQPGRNFLITLNLKTL